MRSKFLGTVFFTSLVSLTALADGGGGNSGASAETRSEILRPSIAATWLSRLESRPRGTEVDVLVNSCAAPIEKQAREFFNTQVQAQMQCLAQADHGWGWRLAVSLRRLIAQAPRITVNCRNENDYSSNRELKMKPFVAYSSHAGDAAFPLIDLNVDNSEFKTLIEENRLGHLLLHETLHWTGTQHYNGPDLVYLGAMCCASGKFDPLVTSCALLNQDPTEWDTLKTQTEFNFLLAMYGISEAVRIQSAWSSWMRLTALGDSHSLAEADLILGLLGRIAPNYRQFWDGLSGNIPNVPRAQHLLGVWARAVVRGAHPSTQFRSAHVTCVELALAKHDLAELLYPLSTRASSTDQEFVRNLTARCTKQ